jgi:hypothetical protein
MPESFGITFSDATVNKQLIARHTPLTTRPCLLTGNIAYKAGAVVQAATTAGPFVKSTTGALPAATDVVGIVSQDIDLSGGLPNTLHNMYVGPGEFIRETVLAASAALDAASILAVEEALVARAMNLVTSAYADATGSA